MSTNITKRFKIAILIAIILLSGALRFYKLGQVPLSLSWDEVDVGYNAWTIITYGKDEYNKTFPFYFRSFGDDKHPVHVYLTALSEVFFGFNDFAVRFPFAFAGTILVLLIYLFTKILFDNELIALAASFMIGTSSYAIDFSRYNHEISIMLLFYFLGLVLFYYSLKKRKKLFPLSLLSFGISFFTYHSAIFIVPVTILILMFFYGKEIFKEKIQIFLSVIIFIIIALILFLLI